MITLGCAVAAAGFNLFMRPSGLASGGIVGISVLVRTLTGMEPAYIQWALNLPLLLLGLFVFGKEYGLKTAFGSFLFPLLILNLRFLPEATRDPLLASVFGGVSLGLGLGLVFRGKGSIGGLTVSARVISERTGMAMGTVLAIQDGIVLAAAAFVLGLEAALYAFVVVFVMGRVIDLVRVGLGGSKLALVVSEKHEELGKIILGDLDRGMTIVGARGGFTGKDRPVLMVVMDPSKIVPFKAAVREVDPSAFVVIIDAHEVLGLGFKSRL